MRLRESLRPPGATCCCLCDRDLSVAVTNSRWGGPSRFDISSKRQQLHKRGVGFAHRGCPGQSASRHSLFGWTVNQSTSIGTTSSSSSSTGVVVATWVVVVGGIPNDLVTYDTGACAAVENLGELLSVASTVKSASISPIAREANCAGQLTIDVLTDK